MAVLSASTACAAAQVRRVLCRVLRTSNNVPILAMLLWAAMTGGANCASEEFDSSSLEIPACRFEKALTSADCTRTLGDIKVVSYLGGPHAHDVVRHCEAVRSQLSRHVFGSKNTCRWNPKCEVVLHASRRKYLSA